MDRNTLYLSKNKDYLTDSKGNNISEKVAEGSNVYYKLITLQSEAVLKVCTETQQLSVCVSWNEANECLAFENVSVCTKWEFVPIGHSNIS